MKRSIQLISLCFVFFSTHLVFGQERISKKDQKEIQRVCEVFLRQHDIVLSNYTVSTDSLLDVISTPLSTILLARRGFFQKMEYENLQFPECTISRLELEDSVGCFARADEEQEFKINLKKVSDSWIVVGYENHEINQEDIDKHNKFISDELSNLLVKDSIKVILEEFVNAWSELRQTKKSDVLKSITTAEFYDFLIATKEYEDLKGYGPRTVALKDMERVKIHQDSAWCRVGLKGMGGSYFTLLLQNNVWLVSGADHRFCTRQDVIDVEEDILLYHELEKFNERIGRFDEHIEAFFKTGDRSLLKETSSDHLIDQLEAYRRLMGTIDTNYLGVKGLGMESWLESSFVIYNDTAFYKTYSDSIRWIKKNEKWLLDELFVGIKQDNNYFKAQQTFYSLQGMFFITYSFMNTHGYKNRPMLATMYEEPDYSKVINHTRPNRHSPKIVYEAGYDQLFEDLYNLTEQVSNKTSFDGVIYVEFDVDHLGKAKNIKSLDQIGTRDAQLAEAIVSKLGNWLPNDNEQSSLTNMVVPIQF